MRRMRRMGGMRWMGGTGLKTVIETTEYAEYTEGSRTGLRDRRLKRCGYGVADLALSGL
jgi:hypothetical protein